MPPAHRASGWVCLGHLVHSSHGPASPWAALVVQMRLIREADKDKAKDDDGILKSMAQHLEVREGGKGALSNSTVQDFFFTVCV